MAVNALPQTSQRLIEGKVLLVRYHGKGRIESILSQQGCVYVDTLAPKRNSQEHIARFRGYPLQERGFNLQSSPVGEIIKCEPYQSGNVPFWLLLDVKGYRPNDERKHKDPYIEKIMLEPRIFEAYGVIVDSYNMRLRGVASSMEDLREMEQSLATVLELEDRFIEFVYGRAEGVGSK